MRIPQIGQYEYSRRGKGWKIYQVDSVSENGYPAPQYR